MRLGEGFSMSYLYFKYYRVLFPNLGFQGPGIPFLPRHPRMEGPGDLRFSKWEKLEFCNTIKIILYNIVIIFNKNLLKTFFCRINSQILWYLFKNKNIFFTFFFTLFLHFFQPSLATLTNKVIGLYRVKVSF